MSSKAIDSRAVDPDIEGDKAPVSSDTTEMFGPAFHCMTAARSKIESTFGGTADAKIASNPLQSLEKEIVTILSTKNLQDAKGYISQGKLLLKLQEAATRILECVNTTTFASYFSDKENARDTAISIFREHLKILAMNHGIDGDFLEWFDFHTNASRIKAGRIAAGGNMPAVFAPPAFPAKPTRATRPLVSSGSSREASDEYMGDIAAASLRPSSVSAFYEVEDETLDDGFQFSAQAEKYVDALIDRIFFNSDARLTSPFIRFIMTASEEAIRIDAGHRVIYLLDFLDKQILTGVYGNMPKEVAQLIREGEREAVILLFHKIVLKRYHLIRENRDPDISLSETELNKDEEQAIQDFIVSSLEDSSDVSQPSSQSEQPIVTITGCQPCGDVPKEKSSTPEVEVGAAVELSDADLDGIADLQEINRVPRPDVVSPALEEEARRLAKLGDDLEEEEDTLVTGVNFPIPRYPLPEGKKVTFGDGVMDVRPIEDEENEPVTQVRIINMGGEPSAPTIPPAPPKPTENNPFTKKVENDVFSKNVASEKNEEEGEAKPTLLQRIRQSKAFKSAVHTIAAGATMLATGGLVSGDGSGRLNSGERHPDATETVPAPAPLVAENNNSDSVAPKTDLEIDDDVVFEEEGKSKYEINEKALEGSKLLAKMVHDGGFERSPGYNGDFSELNLRLNDNASPAQGIKIKQIYQRYATGQYKAEKDPNGNSAPKSRAFYHESRDGFQNAGIGLAQKDGDWNINWKGGDSGSFVKITDTSGEYIPFVKEVLLARGVLVEKGAADSNVVPENVPTNFDISPEIPTVPAGPAAPVVPAMPDQVIHTMNQQVEDVLDDAIELDESDFVEIDGVEVLADADILDEDDLIELGDDDILEIDGVEVLASEDVIKPCNYLAGYSEDSSTVDSEWA